MPQARELRGEEGQPQHEEPDLSHPLSHLPEYQKQARDRHQIGGHYHLGLGDGHPEVLGYGGQGDADH